MLLIIINNDISAYQDISSDTYVATICLKEMGKDKTTYRYPSNAMFFAPVKKAVILLERLIHGLFIK